MSLLFLGEYLKNIRQTGAITPSSRFLARKMVESVDFDRAKVIIEYGPGTGAFTAEIVRRMKPGTRLLVIETNPVFYETLRAKYGAIKGVEILNASAEEAHTIHRKRKLATPDYIISGLPFAALPAHVSKTILDETVKLLDGKGEFITFQYTLLKKGLLAAYFNDIHVTRELRNVPPAYILRCHI